MIEWQITDLLAEYRLLLKVFYFCKIKAKCYCSPPWALNWATCLTLLPGHSLNASRWVWNHLHICSRSNIEENHSKLLSKLAKQAAGGCVQGTFAPVWQVLRTSAEKLSNLHMQMVQKVSELVKEVSKYADELHKKHKTVCLYSFYILYRVVGSYSTRNISSIVNI